MTERTLMRLAVLLGLLLAVSGCESTQNYLPKSLPGHTLKKRLTGDDASAYVNQLHFQKVTNAESEVGFYEGEKQTAVIYISHYDNPQTAQADFRKMTQKISTINSVFINGELLTVAGGEVYRCFGMGQTHFVFVREAALFWVSVNTMAADKFLDAYLRYLE